MSDKTEISWADATVNTIRADSPNRWFCQRVSAGCQFCYAASLNHRWGGSDYLAAGEQIKPIRRGDGSVEIWPAERHPNDKPFAVLRHNQAALDQAIRWKRPRQIFVNSMTDLFAEWVPDDWIDAVFAAAALARQHNWLLLTKRPKRAVEYLTGRVGLESRAETVSRVAEHTGGIVWDPRGSRVEFYDRTAKADVANRRVWPGWPLPGIWLGTSIESNAQAWRAAEILKAPAAVHWVSAEPLLGPLDQLDLRGVDWLVIGGESGGSVERRLIERCAGRPCTHPDCDPHSHCVGPVGRPCWDGWRPKPDALAMVRDLRDRAVAAGVAVHFKQWGGPTHAVGGRLLDGREWNEFPISVGVS